MFRRISFILLLLIGLLLAFFITPGILAQPSGQDIDSADIGWAITAFLIGILLMVFSWRKGFRQ